VELAYRIVDVFSARPLAGNGLCVVLAPCPTELMGQIAREVNLSETTFPTITGEASYDVRIFTPLSELPFAGHPTLGTAWTLGPGRWAQASPGVTVAVEADATGARMTQPKPEFRPWHPQAALAALGLAGAEGCWVARAGGVGHLVLATEAPLEGLTPDLVALAAVASAADVTTVATVRRDDDTTLHVRVFAPGAGVGEDPGTGSVAGPIGVLASRHWGTSRHVTIHQGDEIGRPCRIDVEADESAPVVGGRVVACAEGRFTL
jgi:trans-2,3-dihydro-3-hydroxyanthranilate isomerase